jgi:hypothetical protein
MGIQGALAFDIGGDHGDHESNQAAQGVEDG